jgi:hypothetical protein
VPVIGLEKKQGVDSIEGSIHSVHMHSGWRNPNKICMRAESNAYTLDSTFVDWNLLKLPLVGEMKTPRMRANQRLRAGLPVTSAG